MNFKHISLVACLLAATSVFAQEIEKVSPWKFSGLVGLNASATGLVNWTAGGNNNISGLAFGKLNLDYAENDIAWNTTLDLEYGLTWVDQKYDKLQKASDRISFSTKFGYQFVDKVFVSASASFLSQFAFGKTYPGDGTDGSIISKWLAPSYTDVAVGIDYKPVDFFSLFVSPVSGRISTAYVSNTVEGKHEGLREALQEKYGTWHFDKVTNAKVYDNVRAELGLNIKAALNYQYKDMKILSTLGLFTPYSWDKVMMYNDPISGDNYTEAGLDVAGLDKSTMVELGYRDNNRRFGRFDVNWDFAISYQFLKCLNVTLSTNLKYINGVKIAKTLNAGTPEETVESKERVQFMGVLGLGVGYSF